MDLVWNSAKSKGLKDILDARRHGSDVQWAARSWNPVLACAQPRKSNATSIKATVLQSSRIRHIIHQVSDEENVPAEELLRRVSCMLEEMGYNREIPVLRWLGLFTSKILKRLCASIYVNEDTLLKVKSEMGRNPVLYVPTHRSYGDFILMSYVCFHYELDIPRIAAGMDFHGMAIMGQILRDSCAFFMRRTFSHDKLYSATFSEYVQTLVTHGDGAVEFFIEGTRSRSAKALMPKFGFLSMALKPYLTGLVPDISIVPVSLSYDRCLEERLFAYELLGVPKPKESTMGFIKALSILKENYGNVYINFGEPISVAESLKGRIDRSIHSYGPAVLQDLTQTESKQVVGLAHQIINRQRQLTILTCFTLVAAVLNFHITSMKGVCSLDYLVKKVKWLSDVFQSLSAPLDINNATVEACVVDSIRLHGTLVWICNGEVRMQHGLAHAPIAPGTKLRGCNLTAATMDLAIPFIMLQHYVNPSCHYIVHLCSHVYALKTSSGSLSRGQLLEEYSWFRKIFSYEFVFYSENIENDFETSMEHGQSLDLIVVEQANIRLSRNEKLVEFCISFLAPFLPGYLALVETLLTNSATLVSESSILKSAQDLVQTKLILGDLSHPANLSLDLLGNGIQALTSVGALEKSKRNGTVTFSANIPSLYFLRDRLNRMASLLPRKSLSSKL